MIEFRDALTDLLEEFGTDDGGKLQLNLFVQLKSFHSVCLFIVLIILKHIVKYKVILAFTFHFPFA